MPGKEKVGKVVWGVCVCVCLHDLRGTAVHWDLTHCQNTCHQNNHNQRKGDVGGEIKGVFEEQE